MRWRNSIAKYANRPMPSLESRRHNPRTMPIETHPLTPHFAARLTGIDARQALSPQEVAAVEAAMDRYAVVVMPGQDITDAQQLAFSRNFGPLEEGANSGAGDAELRLPRVFADVPTLGRDGALWDRDTRGRLAALANRLWHSDASFRAVPAKYSILSGRIVVTA